LPPQPPRPPAPPAPSAGPPALPTPPGPPPATVGEVKELVAPVTGSAVARLQPDEIEPQQARKKVATVRRQPPSRRLQPGDLICGDCGEGNPETRKFCSRCGASLVEAERVKTPWWRKLLPRRGAKVRTSGQRSKRKGRGGKSLAGVLASNTFKVVRRIITIALLVGGLLYGTVAPFRGWVNQQYVTAKHNVEGLIFPQYPAIHPIRDTFKCPAEVLPNNGCDKAVDLFTNTFWYAPVPGPEPQLVLKFDHKAHLSKMVVFNGNKEDFQGFHRAKKLHLVFNNGKTADVNLIDNPDKNEYSFPNGEDASSVEIHVIEMFQSVKATNLAVADIEMFEKT
jgi:hypothetical protein